MSRLNSPLLLGFEEIERVLDRLGKGAGEGYPPYNIERIITEPRDDKEGAKPAERLRITLAVAGFTAEQLEVVIEDRQLTIKGRQDEEDDRIYLHRGIAARQFQRSFILADGIVVESAELRHGLLTINLMRPTPEPVTRKITIRQLD